MPDSVLARRLSALTRGARGSDSLCSSALALLVGSRSTGLLSSAFRLSGSARRLLLCSSALALSGRLAALALQLVLAGCAVFFLDLWLKEIN